MTQHETELTTSPEAERQSDLLLHPHRVIVSGTQVIMDQETIPCNSASHPQRLPCESWTKELCFTDLDPDQRSNRYKRAMISKFVKEKTKVEERFCTLDGFNSCEASAYTHRHGSGNNSMRLRVSGKRSSSRISGAQEYEVVALRYSPHRTWDATAKHLENLTLKHKGETAVHPQRTHELTSGTR